MTPMRRLLWEAGVNDQGLRTWRRGRRRRRRWALPGAKQPHGRTVYFGSSFLRSCLTSATSFASARICASGERSAVGPAAASSGAAVGGGGAAFPRPPRRHRLRMPRPQPPPRPGPQPPPRPRRAPGSSAPPQSPRPLPVRGPSPKGPVLSLPGIVVLLVPPPSWLGTLPTAVNSPGVAAPRPGAAPALSVDGRTTGRPVRLWDQPPRGWRFPRRDLRGMCQGPFSLPAMETAAHLAKTDGQHGLGRPARPVRRSATEVLCPKRSRSHPARRPRASSLPQPAPFWPASCWPGTWAASCTRC